MSEEAADEMALGDLLYRTTFNMQDAMSAIEMFDKQMDTGMQKPPSSEGGSSGEEGQLICASGAASRVPSASPAAPPSGEEAAPRSAPLVASSVPLVTTHESILKWALPS